MTDWQKEKMKIHHKWVEEAKEEARQNLEGEDLEKCLIALDNWERNYAYLYGK